MLRAAHVALMSCPWQSCFRGALFSSVYLVFRTRVGGGVPQGYNRGVAVVPGLYAPNWAGGRLPALWRTGIIVSHLLMQTTQYCSNSWLFPVCTGSLCILTALPHPARKESGRRRSGTSLGSWQELPRSLALPGGPLCPGGADPPQQTATNPRTSPWRWYLQ